jgi:hypothetical protein
MSVLQITIVALLLLAFITFSMILSFCIALGRVLASHQADASPVISKTMRKQNMWSAIGLFVVIALIMTSEFLFPRFHDVFLNIQLRIGDAFGTDPYGVDSPVSLAFWLSVYCGVLLGLIPGQWIACRLIGSGWMTGISKTRFSQLLGWP